MLTLSVFSSVVLVGFVNAANISDGANGLLSGACLAFFWVTWQMTSEGWSFYLIVILFCFWLINVITGRIMLGDLGSYFLGAMVVFVAFNLFDEHGVDLFFLASLLSYPCVELVRVMIVRAFTGRSPLSADNAHLHNMVNLRMKQLFGRNTLPNSLTGLTIVVMSSGPALMVFEAASKDTLVNFVVFCCQVVAFLIFWRCLR